MQMTPETCQTCSETTENLVWCSRLFWELNTHICFISEKPAETTHHCTLPDQLWTELVAWSFLMFLIFSCTRYTTCLAMKTQPSLHFWQRLKRGNLQPPVLSTFYRESTKGFLNSCLTVWYESRTVSSRTTIQQIVKIAEKIIGDSLPTINASAVCIRPLALWMALIIVGSNPGAQWIVWSPHTSL